MLINNKLVPSSLINPSNGQVNESKDVSTSFAQALEENKKSTQEVSNTKSEAQLEIEENRSLLAEIFSLIQTGLTKTEHEELNKLIEHIKKSMKDKNANEENIKDLLEQLENMLLKFQKRLAGEMIKEPDQSTSNQNEFGTSSITDMVYKLDELSKKNEELKTYNRLSRQHAELELLERFQHAG